MHLASQEAGHQQAGPQACVPASANLGYENQA